jgi:hypothetical protein
MAATLKLAHSGRATYIGPELVLRTTHIPTDPDALMRDGGAAAAWIPYNDALQYFNPP